MYREVSNPPRAYNAIGEGLLIPADQRERRYLSKSITEQRRACNAIGEGLLTKLITETTQERTTRLTKDYSTGRPKVVTLIDFCIEGDALYLAFTNGF